MCHQPELGMIFPEKAKSERSVILERWLLCPKSQEHLCKVKRPNCNWTPACHFQWSLSWDERWKVALNCTLQSRKLRESPWHHLQREHSTKPQQNRAKNCNSGFSMLETALERQGVPSGYRGSWMKLSLVIRHPESWGKSWLCAHWHRSKWFHWSQDFYSVCEMNCQGEAAKVMPSNEIHLQHCTSAPEPCCEQSVSLALESTVLFL